MGGEPWRGESFDFDASLFLSCFVSRSGEADLPFLLSAGCLV